MFLFHRLCKQKKILNPTWSHSTKENTLIFSGKGISAISKNIERLLKGEYYKYEAEFIDSEHHNTHLMGTVEVFKYAKPLGGAANIQDNVGTLLHKSKWKSSGHSASCNLIISADQINKYSGEEGLFAVTSAHLLLGEDVCAKLKTVDPNDPAEQRAVTLLDVERAKFYAKLDQRIHQLQLPDKTTCD